MNKTYSTIKLFSQALHAFLYSSKIMALLSDEPFFGCGWCDGGCHVLMNAMALWLGDSVDLCQVNSLYSSGDHVLVQLGEWYIDGDGISSQAELVKRWTELEGLPGAWVSRYHEVICTERGIPASKTLAGMLAERLAARFDRAGLLALLAR